MERKWKEGSGLDIGLDNAGREFVRSSSRREEEEEMEEEGVKEMSWV